MTVKDASLIAFGQIKDRLTRDEQAVFEILLEIGPACDLRILEALNQKEAATLKPKKDKRIWTINSVTGRRNSLVVMGSVFDLGLHQGQYQGKNKSYHIWRTIGDTRAPIGWRKVQKKPKGIKPPVRSHAEIQANLARIRAEAESAVLQRMNASQAGSVLVKYKNRKSKKITGQVRQLSLF